MTFGAILPPPAQLTVISFALYIESLIQTDSAPQLDMNAGNKDQLELAALESRVDELIKTVESLASENEALRNQQATLTTERATLIEKTEQARSRVEAMIARLKAMETRS